MKDLGQMRWLTGSHKPITIEEIIKIIKNHTSLGGKIFLGSDSFVAKRKVIFATALCLHGISFVEKKNHQKIIKI